MNTATRATTYTQGYAPSTGYGIANTPEGEVTLILDGEHLATAPDYDTLAWWAKTNGHGAAFAWATDWATRAQQADHDAADR